ncbi:MAG: TIGR02611 family protein [Nocardioides sp.]
MSDNATNLASGDKTDHPGHRTEKPRSRVHRRLHANPVLSLTTKVLVAVVGTLVVAVGVVMLVTPGPAFVLIPLGLAILATEFQFARRWLHWARVKAEEAKAKSDALDPAVRRRRLVLSGVVVLAVVGAVAGYVAFYDWPRFAIGGWDWVQSLAGWVPDLPGM